MVQAIVDMGDREDRIVNVVKGKYGLKNKSEAVNLIIQKYEEEFLEPELRPEFIEKIKAIEKSKKFNRYSSLEDLKRKIENA